MNSLRVQYFYDANTGTLSYIVFDDNTKDAIIIDPVIDYNPINQELSKISIHRLLKFISFKQLRVHYVLETHAHADHLSGSLCLCQKIPGAQWAMAERLSEVFNTFKKVFVWPESLSLKNLGVNRWLRDGEEIRAGSLVVRAIATPGHTPACLTLQVNEWLFTGDALFMPDSGVGRCDFPGGSAAALYDSIWGRLYSFPDNYIVFTGHDYMPLSRPLRYQCSLGEQKLNNIHLRVGTSKEQFVAFREGRDKTLQPPRLLNPSLDWNLGAHQLVNRPDSF